MARVLTRTPNSGARHPSSDLPPHDQRAHGLPKDLNNSDQIRRVLTRQPLQDRACQKLG